MVLASAPEELVQFLYTQGGGSSRTKPLWRDGLDLPGSPVPSGMMVWLQVPVGPG